MAAASVAADYIQQRRAAPFCSLSEFQIAGTGVTDELACFDPLLAPISISQRAGLILAVV